MKERLNDIDLPRNRFASKMLAITKAGIQVLRMPSGASRVRWQEAGWEAEAGLDPGALIHNVGTQS